MNGAPLVAGCVPGIAPVKWEGVTSNLGTAHRGAGCGGDPVKGIPRKRGFSVRKGHSRKSSKSLENSHIQRLTKVCIVLNPGT